MIALRYLILIFCLTPLILTAQEEPFTISGKVINKETREPIGNCIVALNRDLFQTTTDNSGRFSLRRNAGVYEISFSIIGFEKLTKLISVSSKTKNDLIVIELVPSPLLVKEILVRGEKEEPSTVVQEIPKKDLSRIPNIYSDVLRSVQILSGVSSNNELASGYNVHGGSFDENLIYLNGYEIYRPFLVRQGVEENQSLINPEMVTDLKFFNGAFPARYGDKMASALEVQYSTEKSDRIHGIARADFLNACLSLKGSLENLNWKAGFRYAYPALFLKGFQTRGDYKPSFSDIQLLENYSLSSNDEIELLVLYARNRYDLSPTDWIGNFQMNRMDIRQVEILQSGEKTYSFITSLAALKYKKSFSASNALTVSLSRYSSKEYETSDVNGNIYYSPVAEYPDEGRQFLFRRVENIDNNASINSYNFQAEYKNSYRNHSLLSGVELRFVDLISNKNELYSEVGDTVAQTIPIIQKAANSYRLNSCSCFVEDNVSFTDNLNSTVGLRLLKNEFTNELLFSPRINFSYSLNEKSVFGFGAGVYYQPPFFAELTGLVPSPENLKSQRAIHFKLGWENQFKEKIKMSWQFFYKKLDGLIPFYYEDLKMIYIKGNVNEGYAYGFDVMFQGQISDGIDSWVGYGYLNTKEREMNSGKPYQRRLLDQTHTIQIFLQDKFKSHPNWQSHLRFLVGSGFLFNPKMLVKNETTNQYDLVVYLGEPQEYFLYLRADMGLSASFDIGKTSKLMFVAEVLNVFNHKNFAGYDWIRVFNANDGLVRIPKVLSPRFFNLKIEFAF